jgi:hypothetical protein
MIDEKYAGWSIYDIITSSIRNFAVALTTAITPYCFVCYRRRSDLSSRINCSGYSINVINDPALNHDNELWAFAPGAQYLLAFWKNGEPPTLINFPIRIAPLEEARMAPMEIIYDDEGNEAGWKMRPIEDQKGEVQEKADEKVAKTEEKADEKVAKTEEKAETKLQKLEEKAKPAATPTKTA